MCDVEKSSVGCKGESREQAGTRSIDTWVWTVATISRIMSSSAEPPSTARSGGSRSQRRNQAKKQRIALFKKQKQEEEGKSTEETAAVDEVKSAVVPTIADAPENGEQPKKKTKKEKKRERKALEQQQSSATDAEQPRKRARDDGISAAVAAGLRLFVGHLPQSATEEEIRALFDGLTEVTMLRRVNGRFKGSAFLTFDSTAAATRALTLDGHLWARSAAAAGEPKAIKVARATVASDGSPAAKDDADAEESAGSAKRAKRDAVENVQPVQSVFVGNLPGDCKEKAVREGLSSCGKIQKVTLLPPKSDDPTVRCGFVDFRSVPKARHSNPRACAHLAPRKYIPALCSPMPCDLSRPIFCPALSTGSLNRQLRPSSSTER